MRDFIAGLLRFGHETSPETHAQFAESFPDTETADKGGISLPAPTAEFTALAAKTAQQTADFAAFKAEVDRKEAVAKATAFLAFNKSRLTPAIVPAAYALFTDLALADAAAANTVTFSDATGTEQKTQRADLFAQIVAGIPEHNFTRDMVQNATQNGGATALFAGETKTALEKAEAEGRAYAERLNKKEKK